mgnify:CR=1 FL=1
METECLLACSSDVNSYGYLLERKVMKKTLDYYMKRYEKEISETKYFKGLSQGLTLDMKDAIIGLIGSAYASGALIRGTVKKKDHPSFNDCLVSTRIKYKEAMVVVNPEYAIIAKKQDVKDRGELNNLILDGYDSGFGNGWTLGVLYGDVEKVTGVAERGGKDAKDS